MPVRQLANQKHLNQKVEGGSSISCYKVAYVMRKQLQLILQRDWLQYYSFPWLPHINHEKQFTFLCHFQRHKQEMNQFN